MASAAAPAAPPAFRDACPLLRRRRGLRSGDSILVVKSVLCVSHPRGRSAGAVAARPGIGPSGAGSGDAFSPHCGLYVPVSFAPGDL